MAQSGNSVLVKVANAVASSLNNETFSQAFTAQRLYRPAFDLADLDTLQVTVVPKAVEIATATRHANDFSCSVDIGVQNRVDPENVAAVDSLMDLVQQIADHLRLSQLDGLPDAQWVGITNEPAFAQEHLDQQRVFTSVLTVTYQVQLAKGQVLPPGANP